MSTNTPSKKPRKEGDCFQSCPDFTKDFKLINDPVLTRNVPPVYRYKNEVPGAKPEEVADPRTRFCRSNARNKNNFLTMPEFVMDKHFVLPIKPKEVSFSNLNNNVNVKFLEDMCKGLGIIQDTTIYYHPSTKKHLGLGRVMFTASSAAQKCVEKLDKTSSMGNILNVFLDDKGAERDRLFKELTKDPSKAEFMPPMPSFNLQKDVLLGMFPTTSVPVSLPLPSALVSSFTSPGADKTLTNFIQPLNNQTSKTPSLVAVADHSTNGDATVPQRKISVTNSGNAGNVLRSSSGDGLFGISVSGNSNPDPAGKPSLILSHNQHVTNVVSSSLYGQPTLTSPISSSGPFNHRPPPNSYNQPPSSYNSRPHQKQYDVSSKERSETYGRGDKCFDYGQKEKSGWRDDRYPDRKWSWNQNRDYKGRNKNGDRSDWKDRYSPNNWKERNRDRRDYYDSSYGQGNQYARGGWGKPARDSETSPRRAPENSQSFENLTDGSQAGTPRLSSLSDRGKSKSTDATDKNGQTPFSDVDDKRNESSIRNNFLDKRMNLLANSDDNAIDSSHLFVQHPKKPEASEQEDNNHESLESRIQALLGQNLPFSIPSSTQIPVVPQNVLMLSPPPQPPPPPLISPPLPPKPTQCNSDVIVPPPPSIYSFPPPPLAVPLTPIVPPNISYPPLPPTLPMFPVGSVVPPLVNQSMDVNHPAMMVQWRFAPDSTPPPTISLPPLNIPPPPLPSQGATVKMNKDDPKTKQKMEENAKFRKVFNELIYQLKEVLSKDLKKKMVEVAAFKEFEDWWNEKNKEHNDLVLSSRQQQLKLINSSSNADVRNGERKAPIAVEKASSIEPSAERNRMMEVLSGLFDKSGSTEGGLLGIRNMKSMPSFRKKVEPPKMENERMKNIHDDDDDDDDDFDDDDEEEDEVMRPTFRGPRTPEGSENEANISGSSDDYESDLESPVHPPRPDTGKGFKPPSPPSSPIHVRKEPDKKSKAKKDVKKKIGKLQKMDIYSSSSSLGSDRDVDDDRFDDGDVTGSASDDDVMSLVKKTNEPARKFPVYTSDEEEEDYEDGRKKINASKRKAPSVYSSPPVTDSDSCPEKTDIKMDASKKSGTIRTSTPKLKRTRKVSTKSQKDEGTKRKYVRKTKTPVPAKRQRTRSKSARVDDDDISYVAHAKKTSVGHKADDEHTIKRQPIERKRSTSFASTDIKIHEPRNYDEIRPIDGYLHLLSDVASEVKQAEVNQGSTFFSSRFDQNDLQAESTRRSPAYSMTYQNEESHPTISGTGSHLNVTSEHLHETERNLPQELDDHFYSLKPWLEVKSKKGRKPKHKKNAPSSGPECDVSSGDESLTLDLSNYGWGLKHPDAQDPRLISILTEHSYATPCVCHEDIRYQPSDSEDDVAAEGWTRTYVENLDRKGGKKFVLEEIPDIGKEVDVSFEKPEQEKKINVVDDEEEEEEEEEGEYHSSSDEDRMVIDEGIVYKQTPTRKRKRSTTDVSEGGMEKKPKLDKKFRVSSKHASGKLPREVVNLFQSTFAAPEAKPAKFLKRDFKEEAYVLYDFVTKGIDAEDAHYLKLQYEKMVLRERERTEAGMESQCKWVLETKWVDHPVKVDSSPISPRKGRKSYGGSEPHKSGSARTEGYYKIPHQAKKYMKQAHVAQEHQLEDLPSSVSSTSLAATETTLDAILKKRNQQNREARSEGRRYQNLLTSNLGEDVADLLKINQLQLRKKQLRFSKSRIHDWGLFAMEPIAGGELVIEYVGQIIRQPVADLMEKRYEAEGIGSSYLFRIDQSTIIDATRYGNLARFINHCCNPNCIAKIVSVDGMKRIVIYSRRDIEVNEEITYNYKFPIEDDKIPCLCRAAGCRGTLN